MTDTRSTPESDADIAVLVHYILSDGPYLQTEAAHRLALWVRAKQATRSESAPIWKPVSANDATRGVAWIDEQATHIGKIEDGQRYLMQLPEATK